MLLLSIVLMCWPGSVEAKEREHKVLHGIAKVLSKVGQGFDKLSDKFEHKQHHKDMFREKLDKMLHQPLYQTVAYGLGEELVVTY